MDATPESMQDAIAISNTTMPGELTTGLPPAFAVVHAVANVAAPTPRRHVAHPENGKDWRGVDSHLPRIDRSLYNWESSSPHAGLSAPASPAPAATSGGRPITPRGVMMNCVVKGARLHGVKAEETLFERCRVVEADLTSCRLTPGCAVYGCTMRKARMEGSKVTEGCAVDSEMLECKVKRCELRRTRLVKCWIRDCDIYAGVELVDCWIKDCEYQAGVDLVDCWAWEPKSDGEKGAGRWALYEPFQTT